MLVFLWMGQLKTFGGVAVFPPPPKKKSWGVRNDHEVYLCTSAFRPSKMRLFFKLREKPVGGRSFSSTLRSCATVFELFGASVMTELRLRSLLTFLLFFSFA
jgi:hypothetical protein